MTDTGRSWRDDGRENGRQRTTVPTGVVVNTTRGTASLSLATPGGLAIDVAGQPGTEDGVPAIDVEPDQPLDDVEDLRGLVGLRAVLEPRWHQHVDDGEPPVGALVVRRDAHGRPEDLQVLGAGKLPNRV